MIGNEELEQEAKEYAEGIDNWGVAPQLAEAYIDGYNEAETKLQARVAELEGLLSKANDELDNWDQQFYNTELGMQISQALSTNKQGSE